ncbi:TM2 domain-containing protein [Gleimia europaea]|uniref:TM2 domain-containing protein n=1 Tax=Gleimia europaea TaxID=66228 RepID=UPI00265A85E6|nr:TM2 domain-containing protein [Gleimia europaea]MDK7143241.1 TM2 domain-containing protein [Gleimia europaea]
MSAFPQPEKYWNTEEGETHNESETQNACEYNLPQLQDNDFQRDAARVEHASATSPRAPRKPRVSGNANAGHSRAERSSYRAPLPPGGSKKNTVKRPEPSPDTTSEMAATSKNSAVTKIRNTFQTLNASRNKYRNAADKPQKDRVVAGVLAILLGAFGTQNFYLGKYKLAVIQLLITLLSALGLAPIVAMWGIVEGIMYLFGSDPKWKVDGWGRPLAN